MRPKDFPIDADEFVTNMNAFFRVAAHPKEGDVVTIEWLHEVFKRQLRTWIDNCSELISHCLENPQEIGEALAIAAKKGHATSRRNLPVFDAEDALNYTINTVSEGFGVSIARQPAPKQWPHDSLFEDVRALEKMRAS